MDALTLSGANLTATIGQANTMASAFAGTVTSNAGWLILIASASLIGFVVFYLIRKVSRLGRR